MPLHLNIGGISKQKTYALVSCEGGNILTQGGRFAQRFVIQLEISGMHDLSHRGIHQQRVSLRNGMADGREKEFQISKTNALARRDGTQLHPVQQTMLGEFVFHQGQRKRRTVNGKRRRQHALVLGDHPRQGSDMILVPMRQHHAQRAFPFLKQRVERRYDNINSELGIIRKHKPAVHKHGTLPAFPFLTVQSYFTQSPEGSDSQMPFRHVSSLQSPRRDRYPLHSAGTTYKRKRPASGTVGYRSGRPRMRSDRKRSPFPGELQLPGICPCRKEAVPGRDSRTRHPPQPGGASKISVGRCRQNGEARFSPSVGPFPRA